MSLVPSLTIATPGPLPHRRPLEGRLQWHASVPEKIATADHGDDDSPAWRAWSKHLSRRAGPKPLRQLFKSRFEPLVWSLGSANRAAADDLRGTIERFARQACRSAFGRERLVEELTPWLVEAGAAPRDAAHALESLAWCHALPAIAALAPPGLWWDLLGYLVDTASAAPAPANREADPLAWQLLHGELALTLAYVLPEVQNCRELVDVGRGTLTAGLAALVPADGAVHVRHWSRLRPLLACWTRSWMLGNRLPGGGWSEPCGEALDAALRQTLRLTRRDGSQAWSDAPPNKPEAELLATAARLLGGRKTRHVARWLLDDDKSARPDAKKSHKIVEPAWHSEPAQCGQLRCHWLRSSPRLTVAYAERRLRAELDWGRERLLDGHWEPTVTRDGKRLQPQGPWQEVCWETDHDVDYIELEIELTGGMRVQRQLLLAREDQFLLAADAVLGTEPARLEYQTTLPLCDAIEVEPAAETNECWLVSRRRRTLVLPLALGEWRNGARSGSLTASGDGLTLTQSAPAARALFAPLWIDLDPGRSQKPATWRTLTVAENRVNQPLDVAAGYRVQIGQRQWLVYRSLGQTTGRTLLGHHLLTQFVAGRFTNTGTVETLLAIE